MKIIFAFLNFSIVLFIHITTTLDLCPMSYLLRVIASVVWILILLKKNSFGPLLVSKRLFGACRNENDAYNKMTNIQFIIIIHALVSFAVLLINLYLTLFCFSCAFSIYGKYGRVIYFTKKNNFWKVRHLNCNLGILMSLH